MKIKETAIIFILLFALCLTFQSSASASNPCHIDRGPGDVYITAGQDAVIQLTLWKINCFGDDWPLDGGNIDVYSHSESSTWLNYLGSKETSWLGDTGFKVGSDFEPGHIYNLTFVYMGDPDEGYEACENYVFLHVNYPTRLDVTSIKGGYGEDVYLSAKLSNDYTKDPLANRTVSFTVFDLSGLKIVYKGSAMTDSNGRAVLPYHVTSKSGCIVTANYNGENLISGSNGDGVIVSKNSARNTRIYCQNSTGYSGETTNLTSQLTDSNGNPLANKPITFRIKNTIVGSALTDSNGKANLSYNLTQTQGTYNLEATFYGDGTSYDNCVGSGNLVVDPKETVLTVNNITSYYGTDTDLTAKLTDIYGMPLVNKNVTFKVNNISVGTAITDESGIATVPYNVPQTKTKYNIEADFSGDDLYGSSVGNGLLSANPNTILTVDNVTTNHGNQSVLTAKLCYSNGTVLANKNITFKINNEVVGSAVTNSSGVAVLPYKISQTTGNYIIQAEFAGNEIYDPSTGTATLTINTVATKLKLNNISTSQGKTAQLTAQLNDNSGNPISNQTITFKINNYIIGTTTIGTATTDSNGTAVLSYTKTLIRGNYIIQAEFTGNEIYEPSTGTATLTVTNIPTTLKVNNITTNNGKTVPLTAQLNDQNGNPFINQTIFFKISNIIIGTATTDSNGTAVLPYNVTQNRGNYTIQAEFRGNEIYEPNTGTATLTVTNIPTTLKVNNITTNNGKTVPLTAQLNDQNGNPLTNQTITFKIGNNTIGTATTNSNGTAILPYNVTQNRGNYTIQTEFRGNEIYEPSTGTATLTINTVSTKLKLYNQTTNKGKTVKLTAQLNDPNGNPLTNQIITFKIGNNTIGTATTNSNGTAILTYKTTQNKGKYGIQAVFRGNEVYDTSTGTATLQINTVSTKLKVYNQTTNNGKTVQLRAKLTDQNGNPIKNEKIIFKINNTLIGTVTTNSNGMAILNYFVKLSKGQYIIRAQFAGDDIYNKIIGTAFLRVN
ncbi:MAG: Ig-like domain repeat protein [Methanobacterium sp. ERen5]|nr:MAG: Ig-like domain repeat protein [Methanobacterium sp. ERen5]